MEFSGVEVLFLSILIKQDTNGIRMGFYHKPTDTQRCLSYSTIHPKHCLKNQDIAQNNSTVILKIIVNIEMRKALKIPQTELTQPMKIKGNSNLTFISTFNPNNPKIL